MAERQVCCIIGSPVQQSLSPLFHNAGYQQEKLNFVYVAFDVKSWSLPQAIQGIRALGIRGASVTMPHKIAALAHVDKVDPLAEKVGALNTIVNEDGHLVGYNTDCFGVVAPLRKRLELTGKRVAVLGAGGAARAAVCALLDASAEPVVFARNQEKAAALSAVASGEHYLLSDTQAYRNCEIIINATPVGMHTSPGIPIDSGCLSHKPLVFDMVYKPSKTELLRAAAVQGCQTVAGIEMLIAQAIEQFRLFTGTSLDESCFRKCLEGHKL